MKKINITLAIAALAFLAFSFVPFQEKECKIGLNIGDKAPELKLKSPDGKEIALSSLKGNYVLIDFWASWCGPCRRENPTVVSAWKKYKDQKFAKAKGFKIYNVSLDNNVNAWKAAIEKDGLAWETHVSDLGGWNSKAAETYQVNSIPMNFLIDGEGKIIAKNLRGANLFLELDKHLAKK